MKKLDRYIAKILFQTTGIVFVAFVGLQIFLSLVTELKDVGHGDYTLLSALTYVLLGLPATLYQLFPMAGLIGCLLGLGQLASHSELIVMRAAGFSRARLFASALKAMLVITVCMVILGEGIAPHAGRAAESMKAVATSSGQAIQTKQGMWVRLGNTFLHIDHVYSGGRLKGIDRFVFSEDHRLVESSHAKRGSYRDGHWVLYDTDTTHLTPTHTSSTHHDIENWHENLNPKLIGFGDATPSQMDLLSLHHYMRYLRHNGLSDTRFALNMWQRLFKPFSILIMMLLAFPFIFGPLRGSSMGFRLLVGIGFGFAFYLADQFFGPLAEVYQLPVLAAACLPAGIFSLLGMALWYRMQD